MTSGNRLLNMINDLLNMAKTEAGKMELHVEQTSLSKLCKTVVGHFSALTKKRKVKTSKNEPPRSQELGPSKLVCGSLNRRKLQRTEFASSVASVISCFGF